MPVVLAAFGELFHIGVVALGTEHARFLAVLRHALAAQIIEMRIERCAAGAVADDPRLDGGEPRAARQQPIGLHAGDTAATKA